MDIITLSYPLTEQDRATYGFPQSMALGHFDGVHQGHRQVIMAAVELARKNGCRASVMTFHPHPKEVLGYGEKYDTSLTPLSEKMRQFAEVGIDTAYVFRFDLDFAAVTPEQFVQHVLHGLQVQYAVVGFDFTFGSRGTGTPELLKRLGSTYDMQVEIVAPLHYLSEKVSSTLIREKLQLGELEAATELLGRYYRLAGIIRHGDGRGRTIGYPTANMELEDHYVIPRYGVYSVIIHVQESLHYGVMNIGIRPTFAGKAERIEVHLFDFDGDLYGQRMQVDVCHYIRQEQKFSSVDQLIEQIAIDSEAARASFSLNLLQKESSARVE